MCQQVTEFSACKCSQWETRHVSAYIRYILNLINIKTWIHCPRSSLWGDSRVSRTQTKRKCFVQPELKSLFKSKDTDQTELLYEFESPPFCLSLRSMSAQLLASASFNQDRYLKCYLYKPGIVRQMLLIQSSKCSSHLLVFILFVGLLTCNWQWLTQH